MSSFIAENRNLLKKRHYVRKAGSKHYWFDFSKGPLESLRKRFGEDFCLILYASNEVDDSYVIPYAQMKKVLSKELMDEERKRWNGYIQNDILRITHSPEGKSISVASNYNNFDLLPMEDVVSFDEIEANDFLDSCSKQPALSHIKKLIDAYDKKFREISPIKQRILSDRIARPGLISDYLKCLRNWTCQICRERGFEQRNGNSYIETHHIIELHKLMPGSYCSDNIIVVCPTCHMKLHYAEIRYEKGQGNEICANINGELFRFNLKLSP